MLPLIIAVLGTWLLLIGLHMQAFFLPGKVAIFLAILTLARGLLRRVFGLRPRLRRRLRTPPLLDRR